MSKKESITNILQEREALIHAFDKIGKAFKGRAWLMEGRGCYPYNDDRYKMEVKYIMDEFKTINKELWKQIKSRSFEYKELIKKQFSEDIERLENEVERLQIVYFEVKEENKKLKQNSIGVEGVWSFAMFMKDWHEHSSKEYFYKSKDSHQWPPDETA